MDREFMHVKALQVQEPRRREDEVPGRSDGLELDGPFLCLIT